MEHSGNPVADALIRLGSEAQAAGLSHLIIGGNAVIHHGVPRFTRDVDFLIPEKDRESWHTLLLSMGYALYHAAGAFAQYEGSPGLTGIPPVDLMTVDPATWEKLHSAAETEPLTTGYLAHWPSVLHLIALKLHAWRGSFRDGKERDWSDVLELIRQSGIDMHDSSFHQLAERFGGPEAIAKLGIESTRAPENPP